MLSHELPPTLPCDWTPRQMVPTWRKEVPEGHAIDTCHCPTVPLLTPFFLSSSWPPQGEHCVSEPSLPCRPESHRAGWQWAEAQGSTKLERSGQKNPFAILSCPSRIT